MTGKVSVITIFLNAAKYLDEAIASVIAQTWKDWELILVDDGSMDGSSQIAQMAAAAHPAHIRYLMHPGHENRGMSESRNLGIAHASGEFIAFLDADDVWLPEKLEQHVAALRASPDVDMVYGPTLYWHSWTGNPEDAARDHTPDLGVPFGVPMDPPSLLIRLHPLGLGTAPCLCGLLVRTAAVRNVGGFEPRFRGCYEDQGFLTKIYLQHRVLAVPGCWDYYRIHPESCSASVRAEQSDDRYRREFVEWFHEYLRRVEVDVPQEVRWAVNEALQSSGSSVADKFSGKQDWWLRQLRVAEGGEAYVIVKPEEPGRIRLQVPAAPSAVSWDVQLSLPRLEVSEGEFYALRFRAKADEPRRIGAGFAMGHAPWENLGFYSELSLSSEWTGYEFSFRVIRSDANARIHFDAGAQAISLDLDSLSLQRQSDGASISQARHQNLLDNKQAAPLDPVVPRGTAEFGSFRRLSPISEDFGCDRGRPIDRYYIEGFLGQRASDIRGKVLEVGESTYTRRFGGDRVERADVLHVVEGSPEATIIADLTDARGIPDDSFDCVILTQTLQYLFDVPSAVRTLYRILKPGGVLLATVPGITQTYDNEWSDNWYWNFTRASVRKLFGDVFGYPQSEVLTFGNVFAAMAFLHGLAVEEVSTEELDYQDPGYAVTITVRAVKPAAGRPAEPVTASVTVGERKKHLAPRQAILMYHRVAEVEVDPCALCVHPRNFAEHLSVMRRLDLPRRLADIQDPRDSAGVVLTFDDGYLDNLFWAKPALEKADVPATFFVTASAVGSLSEFWWDELERILLHPGELPSMLRVLIRGVRHEWNLGAGASYTGSAARRDRAWRNQDDPPSPRWRLYRELSVLLQPLRFLEQQEILAELRTWAGMPPLNARASHRALSEEELSRLAADEQLVEVGAHSQTHPLLTELPLESRMDEIQSSKMRLEQLLNRKVPSFAYPYGAYDKSTRQLVEAAGFERACTTVESVVPDHIRPFDLPRFEVRNWDGEEFEHRLINWINGGQ